MNKIDPHFHSRCAVHRILSTMPYVFWATWYPFGNQAQITKKLNVFTCPGSAAAAIENVHVSQRLVQIRQKR